MQHTTSAPARRFGDTRRRVARVPCRNPPAALRFGPNLYIAQTQPGLEGVAWEEVAARLGGTVEPSSFYSQEGSSRTAARRVRSAVASSARELARRNVPDRAGMSIFSSLRPEPLRHLRTIEDLFVVVAYRSGLVSDAAALDRIAATVRDAPYIAQALTTRARLMPGVRSGYRLRYRVIARMAGQHQFRRVDLARAVTRGIDEREDHSWRFSPDDADVEFWVTLLDDELILAIRLTDERMRHREYKVAQLPGSLRPSVAAALAWLSQPGPDDLVLDPLCGAGTILIERAHLGRYRLLIGCDHDAAALAAARENVGPRYKPLELHPWDAAAIPLPDHSVSTIITNLPWGNRHGSHVENRRLYPRLFHEFQRLIQPGGRLVILTGETRLMSELSSRELFRPDKILQVSILGANAAVYVLSTKS
jgi:tRNA (guanine6-N2)-methyltransferase